MRPARSLLLALAAGLALADASVVTLALPELLHVFSTSVQGVAAVIGAYTVVLAATLLPAERLVRRRGPGDVAAGGFALFAAASLGAGLAGSLTVLLAFRAVQAVGGAAALVATFVLLEGGTGGERRARGLWLGVAVLSTALGPALGGALTQAFDWRAIFLAQVPIALAGAAAARGAAAPAPVVEGAGERLTWRPAAALALVSAALTAVLFLLVLLLVAGWAVSPLRAAATVTLLPLGALAGARLGDAGGSASVRASVGCVLVGLGTLALAALPDAHLAWTFAPQLAAGLGMGLALPALGGELLPERTAAQAARLLVLRHVGIALALVALAPVVAHQLDAATRDARDKGVAIVLDARLAPQDKIKLAPDLLAGVDDDRPRAGLRRALAAHRDDFSGDDAAAYADLARRSDDLLVVAVGDAFRSAFLITGALAVLAGLALLRIGAPRPRWALGALAAAVAILLGTSAAALASRPDPVTIRNPCDDGKLPGSGGITGFLQDRALQVIDRRACDVGSSREELVLALADGADRRAFERRYHQSPVTAGGVLDALLGR